MDPPVKLKTGLHNHDSPVHSPVPCPPFTQISPDTDVQKQSLFPESSSSIVYETPIRDSQLQGPACDDDIFSNTNVSGQQNGVLSVHKRRKLTQGCP